MRILHLDLDTLRPDHLGCYGYQRRTSPNIDRIAAQGVRFDHCHCSDAPCLPSRAAMMTGQFGIHSGVVGHGGTAADLRLEGPSRGFTDRLARWSLAAVLQRAGLRTVTVSPFAERHSAWWFYAGFLEMFNTGRRGLESAEEITPTVVDWIRRNGAREDWYLHVNYWDPHTPYRAPTAFGNPFRDDPLPAWYTAETLARHRNLVGPHGAREVSMYDNRTRPQWPRQVGEIKDLDDWRSLIDGYDCGIRHLDDHVGILFQELADAGVLDDLVVIISSDHGENLGELGLYAEHATADEITTRVPMIIRGPGFRAGHVAAGFQYGLDLLPTLAELLNVDRSPSWDGRSFAPALRGEPGGREELVVGQCAHTCQRGVRFGPWLYLRTDHDFFHLFPREMLFQVANDPHEERDVAAEFPDIRAEGARRLLAWHGSMMATMPAGSAIDPLWTVLREGGPQHARGRLAQYCKYLERTGRAGAIPELKRRHPEEFITG